MSTRGVSGAQCGVFQGFLNLYELFGNYQIYYIDPTTGNASTTPPVDPITNLPIYGGAAFLGIFLDPTVVTPPGIFSAIGIPHGSLKVQWRSVKRTYTEIELTSPPAAPNTWVNEWIDTISDVQTDVANPGIITTPDLKQYLRIYAFTVPGTNTTLPHTGQYEYTEFYTGPLNAKTALEDAYNGGDDSVWQMFGTPGGQNGLGPIEASLSWMIYTNPFFPCFDDAETVYGTMTMVKTIKGVITTTTGGGGAGAPFPFAWYAPFDGYALTSQSSTSRTWTRGADTIVLTLTDLADFLDWVNLQESFNPDGTRDEIFEFDTCILAGYATNWGKVGANRMDTHTVDPATGTPTDTYSYTTESYKACVVNPDGTWSINTITVGSSTPKDICPHGAFVAGFGGNFGLSNISTPWMFALVASI